MHAAGYKLGNVDATIILQRPKLSPHKETIRANLCRLLDADPSVVNIKVASPLAKARVVPGRVLGLSTATRPRRCQAHWPEQPQLWTPLKRVFVWMRQAKTHENVDSLGENRSIAVHAVIMLIREDLYEA